MGIPEEISACLEDGPFRSDELGMSQAAVRLYPHQVLKCQSSTGEAENEAVMLRWLAGKLPVPRLLAHAVEDGTSYLLMERCAGEIACAPCYLDDPALLCRLLAGGLKALWAVDIRECPSDWRLEHKLAQAEYNVRNGLVDMDHVEPDTFGPNGFQDPEQLLDWLMAHRPPEEPVLSHGDFCLPNLLGVGDQVSGFIDLGRTGVGDKWCDIAICYRSLRDNLAGRYGGRPRSGFDEGLLFRELGIAPDWEKIRYYILLDELF